MKVFIKNKLISLGGASTVTNEQQEVVFNVDGKVISPTRKKFIYDKDDNLLYVVRNRWFNMFAHKVYIYDADKNKLATMHSPLPHLPQVRCDRLLRNTSRLRHT